MCWINLQFHLWWIVPYKITARFSCWTWIIVTIYLANGHPYQSLSSYQLITAVHRLLNKYIYVCIRVYINLLVFSRSLTDLKLTYSCKPGTFFTTQLQISRPPRLSLRSPTTMDLRYTTTSPMYCSRLCRRSQRMPCKPLKTCRARSRPQSS